MLGVNGEETQTLLTRTGAGGLGMRGAADYCAVQAHEGLRARCERLN